MACISIQGKNPFPLDGIDVNLFRKQLCNFFLEKAVNKIDQNSPGNFI
jgi:hypothetical protein